MVADHWPGVDEMAVQPAINPPFSTDGPITAWQTYGGGFGAYLLSVTGAVYALGTAPGIRGANGQPWFAGRVAAQFDWPSDAERTAGKTLVIVATSGERYALPT
jgi:hypothetical protein